MRSDPDGFPELGLTSSYLGVREYELPVDDSGMVWPGTGGMSVAPDSPKGIAEGRRRTHPTFRIDSEKLGPALRFRRDPRSPVVHGFIEPAFPMTFEAYREAIYATAASWEQVT